MKRKDRSNLNWILALAASALLGSCSLLRHTAGDVKQAVWVTRFDYKTEDDVRAIIKDCAKNGFDTVLFQVRGNGAAFYQSNLEPWSEEFGYHNPGFDPLAVACETARETGVQLHAWINACTGWRGAEPPKDEKQLYLSRPEWFLYGKDGQRQPLMKDFYVWLNPCLPEVRDYIADICADIANRYPVDGIHLDYVRFPHKVPAEGWLDDYPRDEHTLALYKAATGKTPDQDPKLWAKWRTDQVTDLVKLIHQRVRAVNRRCAITAAVGGPPKKALESAFQDWPTWLDQHYVDLVFPMIYTKDNVDFVRRVQACRAAGGARVLPGIGVYKHDTPQETVTQVNTAFELGCPGYAMFSYSSLFGSRTSGKPVNADLRKKGQRVLSVVATYALPAQR